jgi:hypothetical protein
MCTDNSIGFFQYAAVPYTRYAWRMLLYGSTSLAFTLLPDIGRFLFLVLYRLLHLK